MEACGLWAIPCPPMSKAATVVSHTLYRRWVVTLVIDQEEPVHDTEPQERRGIRMGRGQGKEKGRDVSPDDDKPSPYGGEDIRSADTGNQALLTESQHIASYHPDIRHDVRTSG